MCVSEVRFLPARQISLDVCSLEVLFLPGRGFCAGGILTQRQSDLAQGAEASSRLHSYVEKGRPRPLSPTFWPAGFTGALLLFKDSSLWGGCLCLRTRRVWLERTPC